MFRRINFYSICFAFGLSILLILAGTRLTDNINNRPYFETRHNVRNYLRVEDTDSNNYAAPANLYDELDIEKILEISRTKIETELSNYNFKSTNVKGVNDLLSEAGGQPLRSLLLSTWRSGTTFLGDILNSVPGNFYHYEPLLKYGIVQIRGTPDDEKALNIIQNMFKCNYIEMEDYFYYGKTHLHQFRHNTRLWDHCKFKKSLCFDSEFTGSFCKLFPFQSMKVVRLRLRLIRKILENKELNVKVLLLVRDPRGVMQSRQHRDFCQSAADCWSPGLLCADMISDYVAAGRILKKYPDRLMVLRYEELALDPNNTTQRIFKFLGLNVTPTVEDFLRSHTNIDMGGVSSTFRVSREVPFRWKNILTYDSIDDIQTKCKEAMNLWGYQMANNATHVVDKNFYPLQPYTISL